MNPLSLINGIALASALHIAVIAANNERPSKEFPLDQIWAYGMPGTREMSTLRRGPTLEYESPEGPLLDEIKRALKRGRKKNSDAARGFAVLGSDMEALRRAHEVLVGEQPAHKSFGTGSDLSAVFFSYTTRTSVHIEVVNRKGNTIEIQYRLVPRAIAIVTEYFAIIPLGKLPVGEYRVDVIQLPKAPQFVQQGYPSLNPEFGRQIVCRSFSFSVIEDKQPIDDEVSD